MLIAAALLPAAGGITGDAYRHAAQFSAAFHHASFNSTPLVAAADALAAATIPLAWRRGANAGSVEGDYFLPWSRHPDNTINNLVAAHAACNNAKSVSLAGPGTCVTGQPAPSPGNPAAHSNTLPTSLAGRDALIGSFPPRGPPIDGCRKAPVCGCVNPTTNCSTPLGCVTYS
jgi:HNH endonuclease